MNVGVFLFSLPQSRVSIYTWAERGIVKVAPYQKHNTVTPESRASEVDSESIDQESINQESMVIYPDFIYPESIHPESIHPGSISPNPSVRNPSHLAIT